MSLGLLLAFTKYAVFLWIGYTFLGLINTYFIILLILRFVEAKLLNSTKIAIAIFQRINYYIVRQIVGHDFYKRAVLMKFRNIIKSHVFRIKKLAKSTKI